MADPNQQQGQQEDYLDKGLDAVEKKFGQVPLTIGSHNGLLLTSAPGQDRPGQVSLYEREDHRQGSQLVRELHWVCIERALRE